MRIIVFWVVIYIVLWVITNILEEWIASIYTATLRTEVLHSYKMLVITYKTI